MVDIFGTLGPSCKEEKVLVEMFKAGMTGIRLNLSHVMLRDNEALLEKVKNAAALSGVTPKLLIDLQGPELRIGNLDRGLILEDGDIISVFAGDKADSESISVNHGVYEKLEAGDEVLLDDGKLLGKVMGKTDNSASLKLLRGGKLSGRKSILIKGKNVDMPTLTDADLENIRTAPALGITGVMLPFVRSREDLSVLRKTLGEAGGDNIEIYAKIENMTGVQMLDELIPECDEIVIARGDLGNAMPLWQLPAVQKQIARKCREYGRRFMVVTQMLSSMEHSKIPTRAEVSDIYNAACDGATSVMVTGETAVGEFPVEVMRYLVNTIKEYERTDGVFIQ